MSKEKPKKFRQGDRFNRKPVTRERVLEVLKPIMKHFSWEGNCLVYDGEVDTTAIKIDFDSRIMTIGRVTSKGWMYKEIPFEKITIVRIHDDERKLAIVQRTNKVNGHWQTLVHMNRLVYNDVLGRVNRIILEQALKGVGWNKVSSQEGILWADPHQFHSQRYRILFKDRTADVLLENGSHFNLHYEDITHAEIMADSHVKLSYMWRGQPLEALL